MTELERARDPATSAKELAKLAKSETLRVREAVARHPNTAARTLTELARDDCWTVVTVVVKNPNTPGEAMVHIEEHDWDRPMQQHVATHRNALPATLVVLAGASDWRIRNRVLRNPSAPTEALEVLIAGEDQQLSEAAVRRALRGCGLPRQQRDIAKALLLSGISVKDAITTARNVVV